MFKLKPSLFTEFCGWYGMFALIVAYGYASFGYIPVSGLIFQLLNLTGAIGLMIDASAKKAIQLVLLNVFWILIGLFILISLIF